MQDIVRQLNTRWVWLTAGGMLLGGGVFYGVTVVFPGSFATVTIQTLAGWGKSALVTSMGGAIGLILACERELVDLCGHNLKMFKAFVLRDRYRLKQEGFFNDENAQKYCCEGVFGSDKDFMAIVDECFFAVILVMVGVIWTLGCMLLAQAVFETEAQWASTLITLCAVTSMSRVIHPIFRFNLRQETRVELPQLQVIADQIRRLQAPEYRLPPWGGPHLAPIRPARRRRGQEAHQPVQAPPEVPKEKEEQHNLRKRQQIEVLEAQRRIHLAAYPSLYELEPAHTKNMAFLVVTMTVWLCVVSWVILKILQCGFGVMLYKSTAEDTAASNVTTITNMTNVTNTTNTVTDVWLSHNSNNNICNITIGMLQLANLRNVSFF